MKLARKLLLFFLLKSSLYPIAAQNFEDCKKALSDKGIFLGKELVFFWEGDFSNPEEYKWVYSDEFSIYIDRFKQALQYQDITLVIVPLPPKPVVLHSYLDLADNYQSNYYYQGNEKAYNQFVEYFNQKGILAANVLIPIREFDWLEFGETPYYKNDIHWHPQSAKLVAQSIGKLIKQLPKYEILPKVEYQVLFKGVVKNRLLPSTEKIEKICGTPPPIEQSNMYEIASKEDLLSHHLFKEKEIYVWEVGTSYSSSIYSFNRFLSEALQLEVSSIHFGSGGLFGALEEFFITAYKKMSPKFLIWEFRFKSFADHNIESFTIRMRQIIPSVYGSCNSDNNIIMHNQVKLEEITNKITFNDRPFATVLQNINNLPIQGPNYYLNLNFSNHSIRDFNVLVKYQNGKIDNSLISRSRRMRSTGEFFLEISQNIKSNVEEVFLNLPEGAESTLEAYICKIP